MECPVKDGILYVQHLKFGKVNGSYWEGGSGGSLHVVWDWIQRLLWISLGI